MLKIVATVNNRQTLFLGLDRRNTTRLHKGQPIVVDVQALTARPNSGQGGPVQDIVLCAGETTGEIYAEISQHMSLPPLPEEGTDG